MTPGGGVSKQWHGRDGPQGLSSRVLTEPQRPRTRGTGGVVEDLPSLTFVPQPMPSHSPSPFCPQALPLPTGAWRAADRCACHIAATLGFRFAECCRHVWCADRVAVCGMPNEHLFRMPHVSVSLSNHNSCHSWVLHNPMVCCVVALMCANASGVAVGFPIAHPGPPPSLSVPALNGDCPAPLSCGLSDRFCFPSNLSPPPTHGMQRSRQGRCFQALHWKRPPRGIFSVLRQVVGGPDPSLLGGQVVRGCASSLDVVDAGRGCPGPFCGRFQKLQKNSSSHGARK